MRHRAKHLLLIAAAVIAGAALGCDNDEPAPMPTTPPLRQPAPSPATPTLPGPPAKSPQASGSAAGGAQTDARVPRPQLPPAPKPQPPGQ
jgi:hypothetical protein